MCLDVAGQPPGPDAGQARVVWTYDMLDQLGVFPCDASNGSPLIVGDVTQQVLQLRDEGLSILLAEQNVKFAVRVGKRCHILDKGKVRFQGSMAELQENEDLARTYLAV